MITDIKKYIQEVRKHYSVTNIAFLSLGLAIATIILKNHFYIAIQQVLNLADNFVAWIIFGVFGLVTLAAKLRLVQLVKSIVVNQLDQLSIFFLMYTGLLLIYWWPISLFKLIAILLILSFTILISLRIYTTQSHKINAVYRRNTALIIDKPSSVDLLSRDVIINNLTSVINSISDTERVLQ